MVAAASTETTGECSTTSYAHLSRASAAEAIQYLDSYAFPSTSASTLSTSPQKRKTVSEVEHNLNGSPSRKSYRISNMSGLSQMHRERARRRRKEIKDVDHQIDKKEQAATFQPFLLPELLTRLQTFTVSGYSSKPEYCHSLDPVALAMKGWTHDASKERDVLTCATCRGEWKAAVDKGLSKIDQELAWRDLDDSVQSKHLLWCPWRLRVCHPSLYRVPVHSRMETLTDFVRDAKQLAQSGGIEDVQISSSVSETDQRSLQQLSLEEIHPNCLLLSLLGWRLSLLPTSQSAKDCIVQCEMCSRKIGFWAFLKDQPGSRILDVEREHKSYCPYVNAKTQSGHVKEEEGRLNAWQQRLQVLIGSGSHDGGISKRFLLSQDQVRKMRSSDVLAKVKSMMM